jgi:TolB-like protein
MDTVWSPAVVNPETVGQRVKLLRQSLGDEPAKPRYIVGVRGQGYRMGAPVTRWESDPADAVTVARDPGLARDPIQPSPPLSPLMRSRPRLYAIPIAVGVVLALAICAISIMRFWRPAWVKPVATRTQDTADLRSLAVLPFADMSEHGDQGFFADGLTEELINRLATVPGLHVVARTSSFYFKGKAATVSDIAKALGVANLLEGSVRESGNTLRITTQLVRVTNGEHVWSKTFDRPRAELFKIQDEIADAVVQALQVSIVYRRPIRAEPTQNSEAYALYLQAYLKDIRNGADDYDDAVEYLHSAVELDPQFADAWALLALVEMWKFNLRAPPTPAACADARSAAQRAVKLNSRLEEAHRAMALVFQFCDFDFTAAEAELNRALEVVPGSDDALRSYSFLMNRVGRFDQALELAQRALSLDPLNPWNFVAVGTASWNLGHLADAEAAYRKAVELQPTSAGLHAHFASELLSAHKPAEAVAEAEQEPDTQWRQLALAFALDAAGRRSDADREIARYELTHADDDPGEIAAFYACRPDADRAIKWFGKFASEDERAFITWRQWMAVFPNRKACFKSVETDQRYKSLQRRMQEKNAKGTPATG